MPTVLRNVSSVDWRRDKELVDVTYHFTRTPAKTSVRPNTRQLSLSSRLKNFLIYMVKTTSTCFKTQRNYKLNSSLDHSHLSHRPCAPGASGDQVECATGRRAGSHFAIQAFPQGDLVARAQTYHDSPRVRVYLVLGPMMVVEEVPLSLGSDLLR